MAEANRIVADGLGGPEGYLRYLNIEHLAQSQGKIIYIPTEEGLPILEAGKRGMRGNSGRLLRPGCWLLGA